MQLTDFISEKGINLDIQSTDKSHVLRELTQVLAQTVPLKTIDNVLTLLEEREKLSTTGIGNGVAVPHCKSPEVDQLQIIIGRSNNGMDFNALDQKPVQLLFLLVAPEQSSSLHLKALAKIARLAKDSEVRDKLLEIGEPGSVLEFLKVKENEVD